MAVCRFLGVSLSDLTNDLLVNYLNIGCPEYRIGLSMQGWRCLADCKVGDLIQVGLGINFRSGLRCSGSGTGGQSTGRDRKASNSALRLKSLL